MVGFGINGQPLDLTESDGTILWSATYISWGKLLRLNQINDREGRVFDIDQPLRYAGQDAGNDKFVWNKFEQF